MQILAEDLAGLRERLLAALPWTAELDAARRDVLLYIAFVWGLDTLLGHYKKVPELCELGLFADAARAFSRRCHDLPAAKQQRLLLLLELGTDGSEIALRAEVLAEQGITA